MGKKCRICQQVKSNADFYYNEKQRKHTSYCKPCYKTRYRYKKYNTNEESILKLLKRQKDKCCICQKTIREKFVVDHNHRTHEIRGLLCVNCNLGLGKFGDRIDLLSKAIVFLYERGSYGNKKETSQSISRKRGEVTSI